MLPALVTTKLSDHLEFVRRRYAANLAAGFGAAVLPGALDRKYPNASKDWHWQFVFPADCLQVPDLADCAWLRTNGRNCLSVSDESRTEPAVSSNTC